MTDFLLAVATALMDAQFVEMAKRAGFESNVLYYVACSLDYGVTAILVGIASACLTLCVIWPATPRRAVARVFLALLGAAAVAALIIFYSAVSPYYAISARNGEDMAYRFTSGLFVAMMVVFAILALRGTKRLWPRVVFAVLALGVTALDAAFWHDMYDRMGWGLRTIRRDVIEKNQANALGIVENSEIFKSLAVGDDFLDVSAMKRNFGFRTGNKLDIGGRIEIAEPYLLVIVHSPGYVGTGSDIAGKHEVPGSIVHSPNEYFFIDEEMKNFRTLVIGYAYTKDKKANRVTERQGNSERSHSLYVCQNAVNIYYYDIAQKKYRSADIIMDTPIVTDDEMLWAPWKNIKKTYESDVVAAVERRLK